MDLETASTFRVKQTWNSSEQVHGVDHSPLPPLWNSFVGTGIHNGPVPPALIIVLLAFYESLFGTELDTHTHTYIYILICNDINWLILHKHILAQTILLLLLLLLSPKRKLVPSRSDVACSSSSCADSCRTLCRTCWASRRHRRSSWFMMLTVDLPHRERLRRSRTYEMEGKVTMQIDWEIRMKVWEKFGTLTYFTSLPTPFDVFLEETYPDAAIIGGVVMGRRILAKSKDAEISGGRGLGALAISGNCPLFAMTCPFTGCVNTAQQTVATCMRRAQETATGNNESILGALLFTCNARGPHMFGCHAKDAALFQARSLDLSVSVPKASNQLTDHVVCFDRANMVT